jgi:HlyD family secretion protein
LFDQRSAQYSAQLESFDQKIALNQATIEKYQSDEGRYKERLQIASQVEGMRSTLLQHGSGTLINLLVSTDAKLEALRTMEYGHNSLVEAQHQMAALNADRAAFIQQWFSQISQDLITARNSRDSARSQLEKATKHQDLVRLTVPERSMVLTVAKLSVGSVLKEGDTLLTLAPMNAPLEAEVQVSSRDVGFVRPGDPVTMKIDAFNFAEHGVVEGKVKWISEDTFTTDDNGVATPAYYRVRASVDAVKLIDVPSTFRLIPGMTLIADVKVGTRALGAYLIGGMIHGVGEAMREP